MITDFGLQHYDTITAVSVSSDELSLFSNFKFKRARVSSQMVSARGLQIAIKN